MILTPPCSPAADNNELLAPYSSSSVRGHEQRLCSSPDDMMQMQRSHHRHQSDGGAMAVDAGYSRGGAGGGPNTSKCGKSSSLPRSMQGCAGGGGNFPSSPKIARCDDGSGEVIRDEHCSRQQAFHTQKSSDIDDDHIWMEPTSKDTLSPRHIRGLSNEKQSFSPLSPNSQRRKSPVSPLATRPPVVETRQLSPCTAEGHYLSPATGETTYAMRFTSRSPRLVRREATDMDTSPDGGDYRDGAVTPVWVQNSAENLCPMEGLAADSSSEWTTPSPTNSTTSPFKMSRVPIAAMEDLEVDSASDKSLSPEQDNKHLEKWKHKWNADSPSLDVGQETLV